MDSPASAVRVPLFHVLFLLVLFLGISGNRIINIVRCPVKTFEVFFSSENIDELFLMEYADLLLAMVLPVPSHIILRMFFTAPVVL